MPVSPFFRFLLLLSGRGVRKHVDWLWREITSLIVTGSPGAIGTGTVGPYQWGFATSGDGKDGQITTVRMAGFATNRTTQLACKIFAGWLRRQSTMKIVDKFITDERATITVAIDRLIIDSDTIEVSTRGRMATWSGARMQLVRFPK
jgi:hypothetical protein